MIDLSVTTGPLSATCCPVCSSKLNAATGSAAPKAKDLSICFVCSALLTFNDDMTVRNLSDVEIKELDVPLREKLFYLRDQIRAFRKELSSR